MKRVLVTRQAEQAEEVCALLQAAGLEPVVVPLIRTEAAEDLGCLDATLRRVGEYRWVVFSSATAVRIVVDRMASLGMGPEALRGVGIVAGPATARALAEHGLSAARVVSPFSAGATAEALAEEGVWGARVLVPRAEGGRDELAVGLRGRGAVVDDVVVYRTVSESAALVRELERGVDAMLFFSPSAVLGFAAAMRMAGVPEDRALGGATVGCIGVTTAGEVQRQGLPVDVISPDTTAAALVAALVSHFAAHPMAQRVWAKW